jgi:phosphoribulokinase
LARDTDSRPVDSLHIHGYTTAKESAAAEKIIWHALGDPRTDVPSCLGVIGPWNRSTPLASPNDPAAPRAARADLIVG